MATKRQQFHVALFLFVCFVSLFVVVVVELVTNKQRCKYTTLVDIQNRAIKSTPVGSHASAVGLLESGK